MNARILLATSLLLAAPVVRAQQPNSAPDAPRQKAMFHEARMNHGFEGDPEMGGRGMERGDHREFWKNPELVTRIGLTPDQVKKLEELSIKSEIESIHLRAALEENEVLLRPMMESPAVEEHKINLQIDKVAEAHAALEKEHMKSMVSLRAVLTPDQWTRLHSHEGMEHHGMSEGRGDWKGKRGLGPNREIPPGASASGAPTRE